MQTKTSQVRKDTKKIVSDYIRGKINVSEARKLLNIVEGKRLVEFYDNKKLKGVLLTNK